MIVVMLCYLDLFGILDWYGEIMYGGGVCYVIFVILDQVVLINLI